MYLTGCSNFTDIPMLVLCGEKDSRTLAFARIFLELGEVNLV